MRYKYLFLYILFFYTSTVFSSERQFRFTNLNSNGDFPHNTIYGITKDKYGYLWFGTWSGLYRYDGYKCKEYLTKDGDSSTITNNRIRTIWLDSSMNLYVLFYDNKNICRYNYETDNFSKIEGKQIPAVVKEFKRLNKSRIYIKKYNYQWMLKRWSQQDNLSYLSQTNTINSQTIQYQTDPIDKWTLKNDFFECIYTDNQDILWIGSYCNGIFKGDLGEKQFWLYEKSFFSQSSLIDNFVRAICEDKQGQLWVGTHDKGITKIDRKNNIFTHFTHSDQNQNSLINNQIRCIFQDSKGLLWFGTKNGIDQYDEKLHRFKHFRFGNSTSGFENWVYSIVEDKFKNIWIGTFNGIHRYDKTYGQFMLYDLKVDSVVPHIMKLCADNDYLWVGTQVNGLLRINTELDSINDKKLSYTHFQLSRTNSNKNQIFDFNQDEFGNFWIGTTDGLVKFNKETHETTYITTENGLPDGLIHAVECDKKGDVWCSHNRGLSRISAKTNKVRNFYFTDGLQGNDFSEKASYRSKVTGELFFGGPNGLNYFYADSIHDNNYLPQLAINDLWINNEKVLVNQKINGRKILSKAINLTNELTLVYSDKIFSIEFVGLHFSDPLRNSYAYMLEGFDKDWINTDASHRIVSYSNLSAGTYIFKVKASNCDGVWNNTPKTLTIKVQPPWWKTLWFRAIVLFVMALIVYFSQRVGSKISRNNQRKLECLVQERTMELEKINSKLIERQRHIEEQAEELRVNSDNLQSANELLTVNQNTVKKQATELEEINKLLSDLNATKDHILSIIAHDLRNPFSTISGFAEMLQKNISVYNQEKTIQFLSYIEKAARNGNNLLNNLLEWSRSQTGNIIFNPSSFNLLLVIEETLHLLENSAHQKNIEIIVDIDPNIEAFADQNMCKTILRNLITNAIKFTNQGGKIAISAKSEASNVFISVADNGVGISEEKLKNIFDFNKKTVTIGTAKELGTGLGLILCKDFIEKNKGQIFIKSTPGFGSTFSFTLPLQQ